MSVPNKSEKKKKIKLKMYQEITLWYFGVLFPIVSWVACKPLQKNYYV